MKREIIKHCLLLYIFAHIVACAQAQTIPADALKGVWVYKSYSVGDRCFDMSPATGNIPSAGGRGN